MLDASADVVEWVKGTSLTRFAKRAARRRCYEPFVDEYRRRLLAAIGDTAPYFYPFKRILFWASRPEHVGPAGERSVAVEAALGRAQAVPLLAVVHRPVVDVEANGADRVLRAAELLAAGRRAGG